VTVTFPGLPPHIILTYATGSYNTVTTGDLVFVPLKKKKRWAIVTSLHNRDESFKKENIINFFPLSKEYRSFIERLSQYLGVNSSSLYKYTIQKITLQKKENPIKAEEEETVQHGKAKIVLNDEQKKVFEAILRRNSSVSLIDGVTGSGKTFLYLFLAKEYLTQGKSVIFLNPHITLCYWTDTIAHKYFSDIPFFLYHAQSSTREKEKIWELIVQKKPFLLCGVHIPLFLPVENLGLIILDEEHDTGYAGTKHPHINTKEAALLRSQKENIKIVLGSATPSLHSYYLAQKQKYEYYRLEARYFKTSLPQIENVTLTSKEKKEGLSEYLIEEIRKTLEKKEKVLLYLNKKGLFKYSACGSCKKVVQCPDCFLALTVYRYYGQCSRCKQRQVIPDICSACKKKNTLFSTGYGIDRVFKKITVLFPEAQIITFQGEDTKKKEEREKTLLAINTGNFDILIGTHLVTKGYHIPDLSLIGVLNADQMLTFPHFMTLEETVRQIIQVSGRAGREGTQGRAILQSYTSLESILPFCNEKNYNNFLESELTVRKKYNLPPLQKSSLVIIKGPDELCVKEEAEKVYNALLESSTNDLTILPPDEYFCHKVKKKYYQKIEIIGVKKSFFISKKIQNIKNSAIISKENTLFFIPNQVAFFYE
jgi:primosomal protein N' (replication factor Y)